MRSDELLLERENLPSEKMIEGSECNLLSHNTVEAYTSKNDTGDALLHGI